MEDGIPLEGPLPRHGSIDLSRRHALLLGQAVGEHHRNGATEEPGAQIAERRGKP
jgi:hypothetical protein